MLWATPRSTSTAFDKRSEGLKRQPREAAELSETPGWVQEMYQSFLPRTGELPCPDDEQELSECLTSEKRVPTH